MSKRTIIAHFEIEDNDYIEQKLFDSLQCEALKDFRKLRDTKELYDNDKTFKRLVNEKQAAQRAINDYLHKLDLKDEHLQKTI